MVAEAGFFSTEGGGALGAAGITAGAMTFGAIMSARSSRKKEQREAAMRRQENLVNIELSKGQQQQATMQNVMDNLRSAFLG